MSNEKELERLRKKFGEFEQVAVHYPPASPGFASWVKKLERRRGEIVLVVPRGNGRVLLHTKPHYPDQVFRLPTGGIHPSERASAAARREGYEEIGFDSPPEAFLGIIDNVFSINGDESVYPSFVFVTRTFKGTPKPNDPDEPISGFEEADADGLRAIAKHLASLPGPWREWGRFRAAAHTWLAERMNAVSDGVLK